jgi:hypothetical protein
VLELIPLAESVSKLSAVCMYCSKDARCGGRHAVGVTWTGSNDTFSFTQRLGSETAVEVIGGSEKYIAVCRHCYLTSAAATMAKYDPLPYDGLSAQLMGSSSCRDADMLSTPSSKNDTSQPGSVTPKRRRFAKRKSLNSPKKMASPAKRIAKRRRSQGNTA